MPSWLSTILVNLGVALIKSALSDIEKTIEQSKEMAETERLNGIRNGKNAKAYAEAKTRAEQIAASLNLLNRNNVL